MRATSRPDASVTRIATPATGRSAQLGSGGNLATGQVGLALAWPTTLPRAAVVARGSAVAAGAGARVGAGAGGRVGARVGFGVGVILGVAAGEAVIAGGPDAPAAPGVAVPVGGREDGAGAVPPGEGDADWTVAGAVGGAPSPGGIWVEAGDAVVVAHAASVTTTTDMTRRDRGPRRRRTGRGSGVID